MRRLLLLLLALGVGWGVRAQEAGSAQAELQKFTRAYRHLHGLYVDSVEMAPLVEEAIQAMLQELDPHSYYLSREEMAEAKAMKEGGFCGIGVQFRVVQDTIRIVQVLPNGAAARVGLRPDDRILKIDSTEVIGLKQHEVPKRIRGREGSSLSLTVLRPSSGSTTTYTLRRKPVAIESVTAAYRLTPRRGYIRIEQFNEKTYSEFVRALNDLGKIEELILDLQGNPGGLLKQAILMAGAFLDKGAALVSTRGRATGNHTYENPTAGCFQKGRLVLLVDESSASASELVSGAIQDWDRGVVVGRPTFGKGLVQREIELGDGSAMRLTIARYHTPSGRVIQRPYRPGEREAYYADVMERRLMHRDTLTTDSLPRYKSLKQGRTMVGGGGIRPDIRVEPDTTTLTPYLEALLREELLSGFALHYAEQHRTTLRESYPDYAAFRAGYSPEEWQAAFEAYVTQRGVTPSPDEKRSENYITLWVTTELANSLYGGSARIRAYNDFGGNPALKRAIELLDNPEEYEAILTENKP